MEMTDRNLMTEGRRHMSIRHSEFLGSVFHPIYRRPKAFQAVQIHIDAYGISA